MLKWSNIGNKVLHLFIVVFGVYSYLLFSMGYNAVLGLSNDIYENKTLYFALSALGTVLFYSLLILFFRSFTKNIKERPRVQVGWDFALLIAGLAIVLQYLVYHFFYFFYSFFPPSEVEIEFAKLMDGHAWYVLVLSLLIAPIFEELVFRKYALTLLTKSFSPASSILISALVFGAYHLTLRQFLFGTMLGILFGLVYYRTGRIALTMLFHFVFNAFGLVVEGFSMTFFEFLGPYAFLVSIPLFFFLGLYALITMIKKLYNRPDVQKESVKEIESEDEA